MRNIQRSTNYCKADKKIVLAFTKGEFNIYGFRAKDIAKQLSNYSKDQLSRLIKRLRVHGFVKKVGNSYKYYLTQFGKEIFVCSQKVINMIMIPQLSLSN